MCLIIKEWELWTVRWQRPKAECRTKIFYRHNVEQDGPLLSFLAAEKVIRKLVYGWGEKERPKSAHVSCVKARSDAAAGGLVDFGDAGMSPHSHRPSPKTRAWPWGLDSTPTDKRQPSPSITEAKSLGYIRNLKSYESTGAERTSDPLYPIPFPRWDNPSARGAPAGTQRDHAAAAADDRIMVVCLHGRITPNVGILLCCARLPEVCMAVLCSLVRRMAPSGCSHFPLAAPRLQVWP